MCKTIKQKVKFPVSPYTVYHLLTNSKKHTALTGHRAQISPKVGGTFSTYDGKVTGINVDLVPGKRVVQAWRSNEFPVGVFSMAAVQLTQTKNGGTELVLTHRGVPKELIPKTEKDWRKYYWEKIREFSKNR